MFDFTLIAPYDPATVDFFHTFPNNQIGTEEEPVDDMLDLPTLDAILDHIQQKKRVNPSWVASYAASCMTHVRMHDQIGNIEFELHPSLSAVENATNMLQAVQEAVSPEMNQWLNDRYFPTAVIALASFDDMT